MSREAVGMAGLIGIALARPRAQHGDLRADLRERIPDPLSMQQRTLVLFLEHALDFLEVALDDSSHPGRCGFLFGARRSSVQARLQSHEPSHDDSQETETPTDTRIWYLHSLTSSLRIA